MEYGDEEILMVKQLQSWWKRNLEKGKGKEIVNGGNENGINGHVVNGNGNSSPAKVENRYKAVRRSGKVVNLNR